MGAKVVDVPQVSFRIVPYEDDAEWDRRYKKQANLNRAQLEGFGYNPRDRKPWTRPKHYMRYIGESQIVLGASLSSESPDNRLFDDVEPIETDLANQVEYDMDEQGKQVSLASDLVSSSVLNCLSIADREWVDLVNAERQRQQLDRLSYELFEVIMDKLEKEWFDLVRKIADERLGPCTRLMR